MTTDNRREINDLGNAIAFIQGGNSRVTFVSKKTGNRFTYRINVPKDKRGDIFFVSVLNGPDNETSYAYIGYMRGGVFFHGGAKAKASHDAPCVRAFQYVWRALVNHTLPADCEIWHEGSCCRCGRALTVPESIESGIGPECLKRRESAMLCEPV